MQTTATREVHNGTRVLKIGQFRAVIVHRWFGLKTSKSRKATWNEEIIVSGPIPWVQKIWDR